MNHPDFKELRQVDGANEVDVIVLWQHREDPTVFGYTVPVELDDAEAEMHEGYASEDEALCAGIEHLADIEGCAPDVYATCMQLEGVRKVWASLRG